MLGKCSFIEQKKSRRERAAVSKPRGKARSKGRKFAWEERKCARFFRNFRRLGPGWPEIAANSKYT